MRTSKDGHEEGAPAYFGVDADLAKADEPTVHVEAPTPALIEAVAQGSGRLSKKSLIRLYVIMTLGYLVSTIQGFGMPILWKFLRV